MNNKEYDFHRWMCPCSDPDVTRLFPEWGYETTKTRSTAICGLKMGGCANGRYREPYCQACIDQASDAEDKILLRLVKTNRKAILSLLIQIRKLAKDANVIGFWKDEDDR